MRKHFIFYVLVPLFIISLLIYLFLDNWVEKQIEDTGETLFGAKVEIENLKVNFFPLGIEWSKLQVANPYNTWTNLFETGNVKFELDVNQLLRKKYIIETIEIYDLGIGTKRKTDGALPESKRKNSTLFTAERTFKKTADNFINQIKQTTPIFDLARLKGNFNPDSLIKILDITTVSKLDSIKQQVLRASQQWNASIKDFETSKSKILEIETKIKAIDPAQLNNVQNITNAILTVDNSIKTIGDIKTTFENRYKSINNDIGVIITSVDSVDDYVKRDFQHLKDMARLPSINTPSIAQLLIGNEMYKRVTGYLGYADIARQSIKKYQPEPEYEKPPRFQGQNIKFPSPKAYPKFWIKQIIIQGGKNDGDLFIGKGTVKNISDNQSLTGLPISINVEGALTNQRSVKISGLIDRRKDVPLDEYAATLQGVPTAEIKLGKSDFLPTTIKNALMNSSIKLALPGNSFDSNIDIKFENVAMEFETQPKNIFESIVRQVLERVNSFGVNLRMWNTKGYIDMALATDLDNQIARRLQEVVGEELVKLQNQLKYKFDSFISQKRGEFEKYYTAKITEVKDQINYYQTLINDQLGFVEAKKKELTERLEKEKSNLIENKLKDLLKR
ncbi:MAG: TIGR03545 family protein [Ignavibacteria bacterium]|nr:TIGR03545 family protein [Ignavibacteria bacterium]